MTEKKKKKLGRPSILSRFEDDIKELIYRVAEHWGITDNEIAKLCRVDMATVQNWKKQDPDFFESLKNAKKRSDAEVEASLFKRATGFKRKIDKVMKDGSVQTCTEEVPPDTIACIFWLKNRQPERWRDKQDIEHKGNIDITPVLRVVRNDTPTIELDEPESDRKRIVN